MPMCSAPQASDRCLVSSPDEQASRFHPFGDRHGRGEGRGGRDRIEVQSADFGIRRCDSELSSSDRHGTFKSRRDSRSCPSGRMTQTGYFWKPRNKAGTMSMSAKSKFKDELRKLAASLTDHVSTSDGQWTIKGFIDTFRNVYTISSDTKVISKILEIHLFPKIHAFAKQHGFAIVFADHQNYYPDISFVSKNDDTVRFALDFKTTYRIPDKLWLCNGFTLGSHGKYFEDRTSTKNIQFPYDSYSGHFCLGIIYDRAGSMKIDETTLHPIGELHSITSVISNIQFFVVEKWRIASDKSGSGNTANIGSIQRISDILSENGMFVNLGEKWFDDYWMNFGKITIRNDSGKTKKITSLADFVNYRGGDISLIVPKNNLE